MRVIALEEHFATPQFLDGPGRAFRDGMAAAESRFPGGGGCLLEQLSDIDGGRIAAMDEAGVDVQVLSLTSPGLEQTPAGDAVRLARDTNDAVAAAVGRNPTRLAAFAALPTADPPAAADELARVVRDHGFVGAMINGHCQGRRLDDDFFWPILESAEALGVPIYLHPTPPPQQVIELLYVGNYSPAVTRALSTWGWGWHIETAIHIVRLILSGAFDRFPRLQFIVGHMGEALPFMLPRLDNTLPTALTGLQRGVADYLRENLHYTFSGFIWTPQFLELLLQVGADRIMFSTDHPYRPMAPARSFLDDLPVSPHDRERIAHTNAENLLHI